MPLQHMEHLAMLVEDIDATCDWFCDNLGMRRGYTPNFRIPVQWLYIGEEDVMHIAETPRDGANIRFQENYLGGRLKGSDAVEGTGIIDHVAFRCTGLVEMIERLEGKNIDFVKRQANAGDLYQLFIKGPNGMRVELNFAAQEAVAAGLRPDMDAATAVAVKVPAQAGE